MRKSLIVLVLCAILVSAVSVTSVVSASDTYNLGDLRTKGYSWLNAIVIWAILQGLGFLKFIQLKNNPAAPSRTDLGQEIYRWVNPNDSSCQS